MADVEGWVKRGDDRITVPVLLTGCCTENADGYRWRVVDGLLYDSISGIYTICKT